MNSKTRSEVFVIGIATYGERAQGLLSKVRRYRDLHFLIVHQLSGTESLMDKFKMFSNCHYIPSDTSGLTISRNIVLDKCTAPFCLISDDDVEYPNDLRSKLDSLLRHEFECAAVIGKIMTPEGNCFRKYAARTQQFRHYFSVSSVEMIINVDIVRSSGVRFDENFGIGARYPSGEELILLADLHKAGTTIKFIDQVVSIHAAESSGDLLLTQPEVGCHKGAMIRRAFGLRRGVFYLVLFVLRALSKKNMSHRARFSYLAFKGFLSFPYHHSQR